MKKLFFTAALALLMNSLSALPLYICTSQGFLFQVTWFTNSAGQLDFILESAGPGSCSGGPWQIQYVSLNPNVPFDNQPPLASSELHDKFSIYVDPIPVDQESAPVREALALVMTNTTPTKSFNPNHIHATWAKSFALANSQDVYFMKLASNPTVSHNLNFQIWSTKAQTVAIKLINGTTGLDAWTSSMELTEGKNVKSISLSGSINGTHVLQVTGSVNILNANVVIN